MYESDPGARRHCRPSESLWCAGPSLCKSVYLPRPSCPAPGASRRAAWPLLAGRVAEHGRKFPLLPARPASESFATGWTNLRSGAPGLGGVRVTEPAGSWAGLLQFRTFRVTRARLACRDGLRELSARPHGGPVHD